MTKTDPFRITNKLPVWLAVPAVLIIAGLVLFFVLGFQPAASIADSRSLVVSHDQYVNADEELKDAFVDICLAQIEEADVELIDYDVADTATGGYAEFRFAPETENGTLSSLLSGILTALESDAELGNGNYAGSQHDNVSQYAYDYIWRAAVSAGVALALAFVYVMIRYRVSMGIAALAAGVLDVAMTLALVLILRIPVTTVLSAAAIFAVFFSVLVSCVAFGRMRSLLKSEEYADKPAGEAMEDAARAAVRPVLILGIAAIVFFALLSVFCGAAIRAFTLPALCAVAASTFSGTLLSPSLAAALRVCWEKIVVKGAEKARLARQKEEAARQEKRAAGAKKD